MMRCKLATRSGYKSLSPKQQKLPPKLRKKRPTLKQKQKQKRHLMPEVEDDHHAISAMSYARCASAWLISSLPCRRRATLMSVRSRSHCISSHRGCSTFWILLCFPRCFPSRRLSYSFYCIVAHLHPISSHSLHLHRLHHLYLTCVIVHRILVSLLLVGSRLETASRSDKPSPQYSANARTIVYGSSRRERASLLA